MYMRPFFEIKYFRSGVTPLKWVTGSFLLPFGWGVIEVAPKHAAHRDNLSLRSRRASVTGLYNGANASGVGSHTDACRSVSMLHV